MISFRETLDSVDRLNDLLKSSAEARAAIDHALEYLADFEAMLKFSHKKGFQDAHEALDYVDKVLVPRLNNIRETLASQTKASLDRLDQAHELSKRVQLRLQMLADGGGLLP